MPRSSLTEVELRIPVGDIELSGILSLPSDDFHALVIFVHGSGSSRYSPRNQFVAKQIRQANIGTLLFDLLTTEEEINELHTGHLRFDIKLLSQRLEFVTEWLSEWLHPVPYVFGFFGASTGAAAALSVAAAMGGQIKAVVSRGGRPDLAMPLLSQVKSPTLFLVGSKDKAVIDLNIEAMRHMDDKWVRLELIEGASHLFEEEGALEQVADAAKSWFEKHLFPNPRSSTNTEDWSMQGRSH